MPFTHEMTAVSTHMPARELRKGHVIRFYQDTVTEFHHSEGRKPEFSTQVYVGTVSDDASTYGETITDINIDLLGRFDFRPCTPVEVICDPEGMRLPFNEEMPPEYTIGRPSAAITNCEYINE
jgi:hypothetical protein